MKPFRPQTKQYWRVVLLCFVAASTLWMLNALVNAMDGLQLNFVVTDTLSFNFDSKIRRTVPLQLDPKQKLTSEGFDLAGPVKLSPDSITFVGPSTIVNKIPSPYLVRLPNTNLRASAKVEVPVNYKNQELVKANIEETEATINIKNLVQEERQLLPELENVPEARSVGLQPASVIVRYQLFEDSVSLLNRESFKAVLNFANFNRQDSTIVPELVQKPVGVRKVTLSPQRVKVTLQK